MTITDTATKFRYEGNASTDTFAFSGKAFSAADLVVQIITRATDVLEETLTLTTDYSVTILANGTASIVTEAAKIPSATQDIQIFRSLAKTQTTSLPVGTKFPSKLVENSIDRAVGLSQDLEEAVTRALKYPSTSSTVVATLPEPVDNATLAFDGTTGALKVGATISEISGAAASAATASSQASAAASSASAAATSENNAAVSAASINLPSIGAATTLLKVNAGATGYEAGAKLPNFVASKRGTLYVQNAADDGFEALDQGTSGQTLISSGDDSLPAWGTSENTWSLLETLTASSSANLSFTSGIDDTYRTYCFIFSEVLPASDGSVLEMVASTNGGSSYLGAGSYAWHNSQLRSSSTTYAADADNNANNIDISDNIGTTSIEAGVGGNIYIDNPSGASRQKMIRGFYSTTTPSDQAAGGAITAVVKTATALNAFRFQMSSGNIASGTIKLYGIK